MFVPLLAQAAASPFPQDPLNLLRSIYTTELMPMAAYFEPMGIRLYTSFAIILTAWFGLETALSGQGVDWAKFVKWVLVVGIGFMLVRNYYSSSLPFSDYSLCGLIHEQTSHLVAQWGDRATFELAGRVKRLTSPDNMPAPGWTDVYFALIYWGTNLMLLGVQFVAFFVTAWGDIALIVCFVLGPCFVPFFIVPKLDFLFWGWLKATLQYSFYKVVAAVVVQIIGRLFMLSTDSLFRHPLGGGAGPVLDQDFLIPAWPLLFGICLLSIFGLLMIPKLTSDIFSGAASSGMGGLMAAVAGAKAGFSAGADAIAPGAGSAINATTSAASSAAGAASGGGELSSSGGSGDAGGETRV